MDTLAQNADEGRGKLRNAPGSRMQVLIRRSLNGTSHTIREGRERRELKRLSTGRKKNQSRCRQ